MDFYADTYYLHAKVSALHTTLLKKNDYSTIISNHDYHSLLSEHSAPSEKIGHEEFKERVFRKHIRQIIELTAITRRYLPLLISFLHIFEINNIKLALSVLFKRHLLLIKWNDISPFNTISRELLTREITYMGLRQATRGTYLSTLFDDTDSSYETLENRLEFHTVCNFMDYTRGLPRNEKNNFFDIMLRKLLVTKSIWYFRLRVHYKYTEQKAQRALSWFDTIVSRYEIDKTSIAGIEDEINKKFQDRINALQAYNKAHLIDLERSLERYFWTYVNKKFYHDFHSIYSIVSYLWLFYYQINNLIMIIDGLYFNLRANDIMEKIICEV